MWCESPVTVIVWRDIRAACLPSDDASGEIREQMLDSVDYELLPEEAWTRLQQWYTLAAGQQPIARKVGTPPLRLGARLGDRGGAAAAVVHLGRRSAAHCQEGGHTATAPPASPGQVVTWRLPLS